MSQVCNVDQGSPRYSTASVLTFPRFIFKTQFSPTFGAVGFRSQELIQLMMFEARQSCWSSSRGICATNSCKT